MLLCLIWLPFSVLAYLPSGNYQESCNLCRLHGSYLSCSCRNRDGFMHYTSLRVPYNCRFIENNNGYLHCTAYFHHHHHRHHHYVVRDILTRLIFNQRDAEQACPHTCRGGHWTGQWRQSPNVPLHSVCQCKYRRYY